MRLHGEIRSVDSLSSVDQKRMFVLMTAHYENVHQEKFCADLAEKQGVLLLYDTLGDIHGFTTFQVIETSFQDIKNFINKMIKDKKIKRKKYL